MIVSAETLITKKECDKCHNTFMDKLDKLLEQQIEIKITLAELPEKMREKTDNWYASKTVENLVYGIVAIVLSEVLLAILYLVLKK